MKIVLAMLGVILLVAGLAAAFTQEPARLVECTGSTSYSAKVIGQVRTSSGVGLQGATVRVYFQTTLTAQGTTDSLGNYAVTFTVTHYSFVYTTQASKVNYNPASTTFWSDCPEDVTSTPMVYSNLPLTLTAVPPLVAQFSFTTTDLTAQFTDGSTGGATSWAWYFGDGQAPTSISTAQSPSHTYAAAGTYTVTLTANRGSDGAVSQVSKSLTVSATTQTVGDSPTGPPSDETTITTTPTPPPPPPPPGEGFQLGLLSIVLFAFGAIILIIAVAWRGGA